VRRVEYTRQALKDIRGLDRKLAGRAEEAIRELVGNPLLGKKLRGDFERFGLRSYRVWPFRIIYRFDSARLVVETVGHRKDVYG